ncbi:MAG: hypothetical protein P1V20_18060 [Verrucomicrobiales bacterium]|nr:hypothetical protein [Verrucomicrobiales bacterium]
MAGPARANPASLYQGSWHGVDCTVTLNELGNTVSGTIALPDQGKSFNFTGSINQDTMVMTVPGDPPYTFQRIFEKSKEYWQLVPGGGAMFFRYINAGGGSGLPGSGLPGSGLPGAGGAVPGGVMPGGRYKPDPATTTYSGFWDGYPISIDIHWDNFAGQGPVEGTILLNARRVPFTGSNPSKGYMELNVSGVPGMFRLNKTGKGDNLTWEGGEGSSTMVFGKSINPGFPNPGVGNQINPNGGPLWLIAAEAERTRTVAEQRAQVWRARGFSGTGIVHLTEYSSLGGKDQNYWLVYPVSGTKAYTRSQLGRIKAHYKEAYGIKADQSGRRETFE